MLNKYYPPDFDPGNLPRNRMAPDRQMKVRMMLPMSIRCKTCGTFMYKGTKFNSRKEDVIGEDYLGIQIYRFYMRCSTCGAEMTMKTDPQNHDYVVEHGASRNYEPWREGDKVAGDSKRKRDDEEKGNAMKALENRTLDSKREMDVLSALDELRSLNKRKQDLTQDQLLSALKKSMESETEGSQVDEEDEEVITKLFLQERKKLKLDYVRLEDDEDGEGGPNLEVGGSSTAPVIDRGKLLHSEEKASRLSANHAVRGLGIAPKFVIKKSIPSATSHIEQPVEQQASEKDKPLVAAEPVVDDGGGKETGGLLNLVGYGSSEGNSD